MTTPNNRDEYNHFTVVEKAIQVQMDKFYYQLGYTVLRQPTRQYDLLINNHPVEEKIRQNIPNSPNPDFRNGDYSDILIEILQDMPSHKPGWINTVKADSLHYVMCQNSAAKHLYIIPFYDFRKWFFDDYLKNNPHGIYIISPKGYGLTLNIPVKIDTIPPNLWKKENVIKQLMLIGAIG
jgi:hypothetical protein